MNEPPAGSNPSFWDLVKSSPSLRRGADAAGMFATVFSNLWTELAYAPRGVRRTDLWKEDTVFRELLAQVQARSLLNPAKLFCLYQFTLNAAAIEGDVAELGVFKGGSARLLAQVFGAKAPAKQLLLFDTFGGLPDADRDKDLFRKGDLAQTSLDGVREFLKDCPNVRFHQGLFSETLPGVSNPRFCLVHVDANLYPSILECCAFFYPRLSPGGILLFDDYGFVSCPGAKQAVDEFFTGRRETPVYLLTGQCVVVRQP